MRPRLPGLRPGLAVLFCLGLASGAVAGDRFGPAGGHAGFHAAGHQPGPHRGHGGYGYPGGYGYGYGGYGFAAETIGGDYAGAPFTRFPRPNEIVPPAWGYGTFGVPTVTGIRQAPTAPPALTVVQGVGPAPRTRNPGPHILSRDTDGHWTSESAASEPMSGIRVISVRVPRR